MGEDYNPFRLPLKNKFLARAAERLLGLTPLARKYDLRPAESTGKANYASFLRYTLDVLGFGLTVKNPEALQDIPESGPVIFVANHPFGGLEGVAMTEELLKVRPDTLVLTNELLTLIPELSDIFIGVDVLSEQAASANAKGVRAACKHLSKGGALLIYPAGQVSSINTQNGRIEDRLWNKLAGRLARKYKATCVPFFVQGRNSLLFYLAGLIHPRLRTALLPRELSNKNGKRFPLLVGEPISPEDMRDLEDDQAATNYLRIASELLASSEQGQQTNPVIASDDLSSPVSENEVIRAVQNLEEFKLVEDRGFSVYCAPFDQLGKAMEAIAFAREVTFRAAGEGTGRDLDVDQYDPHYWHLFCWDNAKHQIVGGYRIGRTDDILASQGIKALYSRSHYHYDEKYMKRLGKSLEMGRSFICPEYQGHPRALDMLWKGIGAYVAKNPEFHTLFGCVSISSEHSRLARAFLSDSLLASFRAEQEFVMDVRPVVPLKVKGRQWSHEALASITNISAIGKLLGRCDPGKSVPILLRHYLALNGRFVCFSVNTGFNDSLDGLIIVDLRKTPTKYLKRYLGKEGCENFLNQWQQHETAA